MISRAILFMLVLAASPAFGIEDYAPASADWYGMQAFVQLGESLGFEIVMSDTLDWSQLSVAEPVIIVYPRKDLNGDSLADWVGDGGRVLLLDDFGKSTSFLNRLNVTRIEPSLGSLPHNDFADELPAFPVFHPQGRHPLIDGVETVVANHPSVISNEGGPVIAFSAGGALVYDMNLGDGKAILMSDSSLFINQMLGIADNAVLAQNSLEYICRNERPCRVHFFVGDFANVGTYKGLDDGVNLDESVGTINRFLSKFMDALPGHELLFYLSLLLGIGMAAYLCTVFPLKRMRAYSAFVDDFYRPIPEPQSEFDWNLSRFGTPNRRLNYALPLSILKELFEELFLTDLELWPSEPGSRPNIEAMTDLFDEKHLRGESETERRKARTDLLQLLVELTAIPPRNRVFLDSDAHFGAADLLRLNRRVLETLKRMGLDDEYKRRTHGDI